MIGALGWKITIWSHAKMPIAIPRYMEITFLSKFCVIFLVRTDPTAELTRAAMLRQ